jgi:multidrug transporter EmrE-like cation transporter
MQVNYLAIVSATLLSFIFSSLYYILLNKKVTAVRAEAAKETKAKAVDIRTTMTPNKIIIELARTFVLGIVLAYACLKLDVNAINQAVILAIWLWIGFPVVLLAGSVMHEHFPTKLAVIHAGDWLAKLLIFTTTFALWR